MRLKLTSPSTKGSTTMSSAPPQSVNVRRVAEPAEWHAANQLMGEYLQWLDNSLGSAIVRKAGIGHADRLGVEVSFASPNQFYVARLDGEPIGFAGVRIDGSDAELTRLFVTNRGRGLGVSEKLVRAVIAGVRSAGCSYLRLETHRPTMPVAYDLYRRLGFEERRGGVHVDGAAAMVLPLRAASVP
ncbi:MAG TPA: GNAT family N-acetyltransferase [Ilumatobacteraceae bacterium]|nr:GNAT family N-acetyltransferase [Ilumatobacteraceae bacterium]